jgi:hypothetical protein
MNDESDAYFVIMPVTTGFQSRPFLEEMQRNLGTNYEIWASTGGQITTFRVNLPGDQFTKATNYLASKFGSPNNKYTSERGYGYENWHILCMSIALGAGASPSDLPYITCKDKVGTQTIDVVVKDIKGINTNPRDFLFTIGNETMKVRMPAVVQNVNYQNGTYADFVKSITSSQYQTSMFRMTGEIKGDAFEVTSIQWILG